MVLKILITALVIEIILLVFFGVMAKANEDILNIKRSNFYYSAVAVTFFTVLATVAGLAIKLIWGWL